MRLRVGKKEIKKSDKVLGHTMSFKVIKNKVARPFRNTEVDYYYDTLFDLPKDIMNTAIDMGIIHRKGAYYFLGNDPDDSKNVFKDAQGNDLKWQGKETVEIVLKQSPALFNYINDIVQGRIPKDAQFVEEDVSEDETEEDELQLT